MNKLLIPNATQVPNILLDEVMPTLQGSSLKVLLAIVRKTYGFQKESDKISFVQLQKLTGLSRDAVNKGIKGLGPLLKITPGIKNVPTLEGVNEYRLNLDITTGELVRKSDRSENLTSQKIRSEPVRKSDSTKENTKENDGARKKKRSRSPSPTDPRLQSLLSSFIRKYLAKVGSRYVVAPGKDPALLKRLLAVHDPATIEAVMDRYFADTYYSGIGFDIGGFHKAFNKLNSAGVKKKHDYEKDAFPSL